MEEALQFSKLGKFFVDAKVIEFRYVCMYVCHDIMGGGM